MDRALGDGDVEAGPSSVSSLAACAGLTVQLLLFGPQEDEGAAKGGAPGGPSLPKVSVVDDIGAIRRAFAEAEEQGRGERP